jgi:pyrroloquinoline quinone biosynthesis protein D
VSEAQGTRFDPAAVPELRPHVRLQFSEARGQWVVQAPERVLMPDEIALRVLKLCDGVATVGEIIDALASEFQAPRDVIEADVLEMLRDLSDKGIVADARD